MLAQEIYSYSKYMNSQIDDWYHSVHDDSPVRTIMRLGSLDSSTVYMPYWFLGHG